MAGYNNTSKDVALDAIGAAATYISLHSTDPSTTGANEISGGSYARVATTWSSASGSSKSGSAVVINVPAGVTVEYWGVWTLGTAGVYYEGGALPANETYGGAGTYTLTPTLTATG